MLEALEKGEGLDSGIYYRSICDNRNFFKFGKGHLREL